MSPELILQCVLIAAGGAAIGFICALIAAKRKKNNTYPSIAKPKESLMAGM